MLDDLDAFVDQELGSIGLDGGAAIPSARMVAAGLFCGLEGGLGVGMGNPSTRVFWRIVPAGPDVIRHLGDGRGKEMGVMRVHAPKVILACAKPLPGLPACCSGTGGTGGTGHVFLLTFSDYAYQYGQGSY